MEPDGFAGRVAIVTGAGKGIGQATAIAFAARKAKVILGGRTPEPLQETQDKITQGGGVASIVLGDVADEAFAVATVARALDEYGRLDFAVNNAGVSPTAGNTAEWTAEEWRRVIDVNLTGLWLGMRHQLPAIERSGGGAIVNMSSVAALKAFAGRAPYTASKWGVVGLTKVAAVEFANKRIRVNAIAPGAIDTPLFAEVIGASSGTGVDYQSLTPMGRVAAPEEVASVAVWLCSDEASFVTGALVPADGAMTL
jgi:NAD(P)-dependent dehydrogenase (short-subunit alcohol dehydrogenase family)